FHLHAQVAPRGTGANPAAPHFRTSSILRKEGIAPNSGDNLLDQMDRHFWAWHGGDLALQAARALPTSRFIQQGQYACAHTRRADIGRSEAQPGTSRNHEIADDVLIRP